MPTLTAALNTTFTPTKTSFAAQVTGGTCYLERRQTAGAAWAPVLATNGQALMKTGAYDITNVAAGSQYRFVAATGNPVVQADE